MTAIVNTNLFTNLHSKHIFDVIYITSNDCYLVFAAIAAAKAKTKKSEKSRGNSDA